MIKDKLEMLANQLFSIRPEEESEPYILTESEERVTIENEIDRLKKHKAWKMAQTGMKDGEILTRLSMIDWENEIDRQSILKRANSNKNYALWQEGQRQREKELEEAKIKELVDTWTANRIYKLMGWTSKEVYGKDLIVNDDTLPLVKTICFFLSRDPRFETELQMDLNKGLLIRGVSGLGKTHVVKCAADNELNPVTIVNLIEITDEIKREGAYTLPTGRRIIYLDDVGTEETPVNYFGTKITWFKDFIELYYSKNRPFKNLMISTNNSFSQIEDKYGFRVRSRMKDMFNVVDVTGKDMRGK